MIFTNDIITSKLANKVSRINKNQNRDVLLIFPSRPAVQDRTKRFNLSLQLAQGHTTHLQKSQRYQQVLQLQHHFREPILYIADNASRPQRMTLHSGCAVAVFLAKRHFLLLTSFLFTDCLFGRLPFLISCWLPSCPTH